MANTSSMALEDYLYRMLNEFASMEKNEEAHWEKAHDDICYWYRCSRCHEHPAKDSWGNDYFSAYCPSCGRKMATEIWGEEEQND